MRTGDFAGYAQDDFRRVAGHSVSRLVASRLSGPATRRLAVAEVPTSASSSAAPGPERVADTERLAEWHLAAPGDVRGAFGKMALGHRVAAAPGHGQAGRTIRHRVEGVLVLRAGRRGPRVSRRTSTSSTSSSPATSLRRSMAWTLASAAVPSRRPSPWRPSAGRSLRTDGCAAGGAAIGRCRLHEVSNLSTALSTLTHCPPRSLSQLSHGLTGTGLWHPCRTRGRTLTCGYGF